MRILVTGGAGFIGSHIVDRYQELGHQLLVVDDLSGGRREHLAGALGRGARLEVADIRSPDAVAAVRAFAPEVVNHHAAQMDVRKSVADPAHDADVNLVGMLRVLEAARLGGALQHVIFASSGGAMYGEQDVFPAPEQHPVRPESPYGLAKAVTEQYLGWYQRMYGLGFTALRYGNVYGPRQSPHGEAGVVAIFCGRILEGRALTVFGDGRQTRDYVFVDDVVEANALALQHRPPGGFNIGTAVETDVLQLASRLIEASGRDVKVVHEAARPGEQKRSVIDPAAYARATAWRPRVAVADGLTRTFRWFAQGKV